ncbi:hypothetical protein [Streptomyces sp. SCL15-4]|nr:hypothetical protein [Streptomyces sp. SCL15-4]
MTLRKTSGPRAQCPGGTGTLARHLAQNKRTGVVAHVSARAF